MDQPVVRDRTGTAADHALLFELADALVAVVDGAGAVLQLAPRWTPIAGPAPGRLHDLIEEHDRSEVDDALARASASGRARFDAALADGGGRFEFRLGGHGGELLVSAGRDGPAADFAREITRHTSAGLTLFDAEGRFRYVNDAYCALVGYAPAELLDRPFTMALPCAARDEAMAHHRQVLDSAPRARARELRLLCRDGSELPIASHDRRIDMPDGQRLRLATVFDLRSMHEGRRRLADAEARLRDVTDSLPGAVYQLCRTPDGRYRTTFMSEGLRRMTGLAPSVALADLDTVLGLLPEADAARAIELTEISARDQTPYEQEFSLRGPSGTHRIQARAQPRMQDDGSVVWNGMMIDISERKSAEDRLADAEARMRAITEALPGAIYQFRRSTDGQCGFTYVSEGLRRMCGLADERPIGDFQVFLELVPEGEREELVAAVRHSEQTLTPFQHEFRLRGPERTVWVEARSIPTREPDGSIVCNGLMVDVTERRAARAEADRLNAILQSTPDCVAITDTEGGIRYFNAGGRALLGLAADEDVTGRSFFEFMAPADAAHIRDHASRKAAEHGCWEGESTVVTCDGREIPVSQTLLCHRDRRGRIVRYSTVIRDLSERVAVESELRASEARYRELYDRTPTMLHSIDAQGRLIGVSAYWLEHLGYSRAEVIGRPSTDFLTAESQLHAQDVVLPEFLRKGRCVDVPYRVVRRDGEVRDVLLSANAEFDDNGEMIRSLAVMVDVTEQRHAEENYRDIFENANEGIYRSTPEGRLVRANPALVRLHGLASEQELLDAVTDIARDWYVDPEDRGRMMELLHRDGRVENFEAEIWRSSTGERLWTSENARIVHDRGGHIAYFEGTVRDITAQHKAAQLAEYRGEILEMIARDRSLTGTLYEIVGLLEQQHARLTAAIFRLQRDRLYAAAAPGLSNRCIEAVDGRIPADVGGAVAAALESDRQAIDTAFPATEADGSDFAAAVHASGYGAVAAVPIRDQHGAVLGILAAFAQYARELESDWTGLLNEMAQIASIGIEQHRLSQQLLRQAQYDALTDLPNRSLLTDRLNQGILDARRTGQRVAVLLLDLDEFKLVNDTLGHSAGDELLQKVSARLRNTLRAGDTVARLGGDEFVIVVPLHGAADATDVAERVHAALQGSVRVADREVTARPSIGISIYPQDGETTEALLQAADTAMYAAKHAGRNRYRYFAETMNRQVSERLQVEAELRHALGANELELYFQPQIALADHRLVGAEALLRWNHPQRGLVGPGDFLPVAERGPLIGQIDRFVLDAAAHALAGWQALGRNVRVGANLSARELHAEGFGAEVADILARAGADPAGFELEITESMLMQDIEHATRQLLDLRERAPGLRVAIDDFGSGYSSLNYLRHLPIDTLKVDRSFVADIDRPDRADTACAIVRTVVELGRSLGLAVIAEGVERESQARVMHELGCQLAQGFWFDRPMPAARFRERLGLS